MAVPIAERETRRAALEERLAALELEEEKAIVQLERVGVTIDRRSDVEGHVLFHPEVLAAESGGGG